MKDEVPERESDQATLSKQQARVKLRRSFLKATLELNAEQCSIITYEQSILKAKFMGWSVDGTEVLVDDLKTPAAIEMPSAILRTTDILAIQFEKPVLLS